MMKCHEVCDMLTEYLDGSLDAALQDEIADHLSGCIECRREMEELQEMLSIIHTIPRQEPVFDLWEEFAPKFSEINASITHEEKTRNIPFSAGLVKAIREGWSMFICITGYNTARKIRYITRAE